MRQVVAETLVTLWNRTYPPGVEVGVVKDDGSILDTRTRTPAWFLGSDANGCTPVVMVDGLAGGYELARVLPLRK